MMDATSLIAQLVDKLDEGAMVTKFVVVAEVIDGQGERAVWIEDGGSCASWDIIGLLTYALEVNAAAVDEDDDCL